MFIRRRPITPQNNFPGGYIYRRRISNACYTNLSRRLHRRGPRRGAHHHVRGHLHRGFYRPAAGKTVWEDDGASSKVAAADEASDGKAIELKNYTGTGLENKKEGLYALKKVDLFNILCIPPYKSDGDVDTALMGDAATFCEKHRAMLLVDPPIGWENKDDAKDKAKDFSASVGTNSKNAAIFFPRLKQPNPMHDNHVEAFAPCGAVAGVFARTDAQRGVWKAPAGLDAGLVGVPQLSVPLNDAENGELNPLGVNCLRAMPAAGRMIWGSRTLHGNDRRASEWKYIPGRGVHYP